MPASLHGHGSRTYAAWQAIGVARADGLPYPRLDAKAQPWIPVPGGPAFLLGANFFAAKSYNPSMSYALALVYLGDRCSSGRPFVQKFPGQRTGTYASRSPGNPTKAHRDWINTGGTDGRIGNDTTLAVQNFQRKAGISPADGDAGVGLLARLRQAS